MSISAIALRADDGAWDRVTEVASKHDVYHTSAYHRMAELAEEGEARLYVVERESAVLALPLLLRPLRSVPGLEEEEGFDATSVYGYPGPIASSVALPPDFRASAWREIAALLRDQKVVCVFSRLHPLISEQAEWVDELGELHEHGETVSIDLSLPGDDQYRRYRRDHRAGVRKLAKQGYTCFVDTEFSSLATFIHTYRENMRRVGAKDYYFFDDNYFHTLISLSGASVELLIVRHEDRFACGSLFLRTDGIVQYHLSATSSDYLRSAPAKLLLDFARRRYTELGADVLHLGGGLGAREDSLFLFKAGFSDRRHAFRSWRWVCDPHAYARLCAKRDADRAVPPEAAHFFPRFRV